MSIKKQEPPSDTLAVDTRKKKLIEVYEVSKEVTPETSPRSTEAPSRFFLHEIGTQQHACSTLVQRGQGVATVVAAVYKSNKFKNQEKVARKGKGRGKKPKRERPNPSGHHVGFVLSPTMLMPDEVVVTMPYAEAIVLTTNGAGGYTARRQVNALYDPDPAVGGVSFTGLASWKNLYSYYRVLSYDYCFELSNGEAFPVYVSVLNTNTDPGSSAYGNAALCNQAFTKTKYLGPLTGDGRAVVRGHVEISRLLGSNAFEQDDNWRGLTGSANPADLIWCTINVSASGGHTMTTEGVKGFIKFMAKTRLYDRVEQTA